MNILPLLLADFYKVGHPAQYPKNTVKVYSNLTPRKSRLKGIDHMVFFGLQYFIKEYLIRIFNENFFELSKEEVMRQYKRRLNTSLGGDLPFYDHIEKLHDLGYLPIEIKALPEGSRVGMRVPVLTITNTLPEHYWLPNFLETILSCIVWQPSTSATLAFEYRKLLNKYAKETGMPMEFVQWQGHDFSFRGMSSLETAITSAMGHLLSFTGTDTIPAIDGLEQYYNANAEKELIGGSVNATEHSVMCAGEKDSEQETFRRLIQDVYPSGIVSVVSDTWDLWKVCTEILPALKFEVLGRNGKLVIRPDSGNPVDIICGTFDATSYKSIDEFGDNIDDAAIEYATNVSFDEHDGESVEKLKFQDKYYEVTFSAGECVEASYDGAIFETDVDSVREVNPTTPADKGVVELLWEVFGGTVTSTGHKLLDSHIGAIYGDSITLERADEICKRLAAKGFASQVVFGIGSYTYQYNTRDTFGTAMKATYVEIGDEAREIWKDPITDDGTKKSATGLLKVELTEKGYALIDRVSKEEEASTDNELTTVYLNGKLVVDQSLSEIRARISKLL